jgi:hypothetical protein
LQAQDLYNIEKKKTALEQERDALRSEIDAAKKSFASLSISHERTTSELVHVKSDLAESKFVYRHMR